MPKRLRRILLLLLLPATALVVYAACQFHGIGTAASRRLPIDGLPTTPQARTPNYLRVLYIGNSFTNFCGGQAAVLRRLVESAHERRPVIAEQVTASGQDLKYHWTQGPALARIREGNWDYVVLQDQSSGPIDDQQDMDAYARLFDAEIRKVGARTVFFMTWAKKDEPRNQAVLARAYQGIAQELGADVVPVGLVWQTAQHLDPRLNLYGPDSKHPNDLGVYLAGCAFYRFFYGHNASGLTYVIQDVYFRPPSAADITFVQDVVDRTVTRFAQYRPAATAATTEP